jgi:hypothetical protein
MTGRHSPGSDGAARWAVTVAAARCEAGCQALNPTLWLC